MTSTKRDAIVQGAEQLMLEEGYASVTFRAVASRAGVTAGLVQYYFPTLDDLFVALLRDATDRTLDRIAATAEADQPLRAVWEYASNRRGNALLLELMALANHRKAIAPIIGEGGERVRQAQLDALEAKWPDYGLDEDDVSPHAVLFLMSCIPRMAHLEEAFGTRTGHREAISLVEQFLDRVEPR